MAEKEETKIKPKRKPRIKEVKIEEPKETKKTKVEIDKKEVAEEPIKVEQEAVQPLSYDPKEVIKE